MSDEEGNRLGDDEAELVRKMVAARPRRHWEVVQKLSVLEKVMEDHNWYDRREWLLLASLKCDVAEIYD